MAHDSLVTSCDAVSLCHFEALKPRCRHGGLFCMSVRLKVSTVGAKLMLLFFATAVYEILFPFELLQVQSLFRSSSAQSNGGGQI